MFDNESVSRENRDKLLEYSHLLTKWNKQINLVSSDSIKDIEQRHILDSVQLLNYIKEKDITILDLGSGAGLPGLVLSICGIKRAILVESDERKSAFLLQASKISSESIEIKNSRVEALSDLSCDIVVSRAFADLNSIFNYCKNIIVRSKFLLLKGKTYKNEIAEAKKHWLFKVKIHDSITSAEGKILEIINVKPRIL
jgi:16S rRNA (guanine527-N7)-methyltransferase